MLAVQQLLGLDGLGQGLLRPMGVTAFMKHVPEERAWPPSPLPFILHFLLGELNNSWVQNIMRIVCLYHVCGEHACHSAGWGYLWIGLSPPTLPGVPEIDSGCQA